jgi:hypothetical protein
MTAKTLTGLALDEGFFYSLNVEVTGAARLYRAASSDRRERGRPPGYASCSTDPLLGNEYARQAECCAGVLWNFQEMPLP